MKTIFEMTLEKTPTRRTTHYISKKQTEELWAGVDSPKYMASLMVQCLLEMKLNEENQSRRKTKRK